MIRAGRPSPAASAPARAAANRASSVEILKSLATTKAATMTARTMAAAVVAVMSGARIRPSGLDYSRAEAAADARRQRVKLYSDYCEPFATKQMRPDRLARRVKTPVLVFLVRKGKTAFS